LQAKIGEQCKQLEMYNENKITIFASNYYFYHLKPKIECKIETLSKTQQNFEILRKKRF